jgi:cytochrome c553
MNRQRILVVAAAWLLGSTVALAANADTKISPEAQAAAAKLAKQECALCHGATGKSISPTFPRLAGQQAEYIKIQLHAFKDQTRKDPDAQAYMWGMASQLNDEVIEALGHYFQNLPPMAAKPEDAKVAGAGKTIFEDGIPSIGVPACKTCHLAKAQGNGQFPRLAGQHVAYLVKQMRSFKSGLRASPIMEPIMHNMTAQQMTEVATYLRSQP